MSKVADNHLPHARGDEPDGNDFDYVQTVNLPHARGDEPAIQAIQAKYEAICPTHVGMNRHFQLSETLHW